ncbi:two-component response regulator-like PRR37 isoform X4 [Phragmites australis]|uniref:two-component response regulator-like PRR37 isoform X4 n=1 Tax=Phragmites australis TaxID=29695 RepID=UPI002D79CAB3|nr:two-component response regulator-like PRR37 isoform X4 [Phragmites australis]
MEVARQQPGVDGPCLRDARLLGNGAVGGGYRLQGEEDLRNNDPDGLLSGPTSGAQQGDMENQQQQVCWERFLQKKTIKVLLVESDDSTRQVVSALLRHCMYEVIPAENGQQAWTYLEDLQNSIDLVLAEVFMPGVSGICLLSRIMSHNICKNIPVIMMSSNDAMGTVFKCLSKGAVDFLVKPIRKNELKNLWQHVWRRCHSSSGSGSESGIQTQKCAKSKGGDESDNNSGSNDDDDDASMGLNARDGGDNGSGTQDFNDLMGLGANQRMTQSSWTKRAVEIDSPQAMSPDQLADPPDSTCAQVIHPKSEICSNRWLPDDFKGKDMEIGAPRNLKVDHQSSPNERPTKPADRRCEYPPENNSKETMMENLEEATVRAADLIGSMAKNMDAQQAARAADAPNCSSKAAPEGKDKNHDNILPSLELSLKRSRSTGDGADTIQDEQRNVLRRSDPSAFTRYHTSAASNQGGTGFVGSCSLHDNSSEAMKTDSTYNMKSNSDAAPIKQGSNGSSNNNDMGSTTKNVVTKPATNKERVMSPSAIKANAHTSAFHPVQHWTLPANATRKAKADEVANNAAKNAHPGEVQSNLVQHPRPILHYVHFDVSRENGGSGAPQCGSSNVFDLPLEGQAANYGVNGSNSGSNNGTNGQNRSTAAASMAAANAERTNTEIANGAIDKNGPGGGNGSGSGSGNDTYVKRLAPAITLRETQLIKYREKRKDRNFGKKVRYQSRKRLAEKRPRVRGQFVKQAVQDQGGREGAADR